MSDNIFESEDRVEQQDKVEPQDNRLIEFCPRCFSTDISGQGRRISRCLDCDMIMRLFPSGIKTEIPEKKNISSKDKKQWDNNVRTLKSKNKWVLVAAVVIFSFLYFKVDVIELKIGIGVLIAFMFLLQILDLKKEVRFGL
mgnify:CR=1 FL=1